MRVAYFDWVAAPTAFQNSYLLDDTPPVLRAKNVELKRLFLVHRNHSQPRNKLIITPVMRDKRNIVVQRHRRIPGVSAIYQQFGLNYPENVPDDALPSRRPHLWVEGEGLTCAL